MGEQPEADVILGAITWQGNGADETSPTAEGAEVIRFAPYLLARRGQAIAPPRPA